jgi:Lrp/AsnC family transcriptional regulator, regulator for asnA, asnC and gidA
MTTASLCDDLDTKIVEQLVRDGRLSAASIAKRIGGVTERTVRTRMNSLIERRLISVGAIVDPATLGNHVIADLWIEVEPGRTLEIADKLVDYEELSYVACSSGNNDITVMINAPDNHALLEFAEVIGRVPGVRKVTVSTLLALLKTTGFKTLAADHIRARLSRRNTSKSSKSRKKTDG